MQRCRYEGAIPTWNRPLSRSPNISLYKNQLLLFAVARPDPRSIQWMSTPGWPPRCSPSLSSSSSSSPRCKGFCSWDRCPVGTQCTRNRNEWTTITWCPTISNISINANNYRIINGKLSYFINLPARIKLFILVANVRISG